MSIYILYIYVYILYSHPMRHAVLLKSSQHDLLKSLLIDSNLDLWKLHDIYDIYGLYYMILHLVGGFNHLEKYESQLG